jgi:hypothetical protein
MSFYFSAVLVGALFFAVFAVAGYFFLIGARRDSDVKDGDFFRAWKRSFISRAKQRDAAKKMKPSPGIESAAADNFDFTVGKGK